MLSRLPDELLAVVAEYVFTEDDLDYSAPSYLRGWAGWVPPKSSPVRRNWGYGRAYLLALSMVDRRTRAVVLELLMPVISVQTYNIPNLICMYLRYPDLSLKTKTLELKRRELTSKRFSWDGFALAPWGYPSEAFLEACRSVVNQDPTTDPLDKGIWMHELKAGKTNALLAILFSMLPNLEKLILQKTELGNLAFLTSLFLPSSYYKWSRLSHWNCEYLTKVFAPHVARLKDLEMPRNWKTYSYEENHLGTLHFSAQIPVHSLLSLQSMRRFVAPEAALFHSYQEIEANQELATLRHPYDILPQSLESITIFNVDFRTAFKKQDHRILEWLRILFTQMWESRQQQSITRNLRDLQQYSASILFPRLRYIYIEYQTTCAFFDHSLTLYEWAKVELMQQEIQRVDKDFLGTEVEFSFPWVGDPFLPY
ncbi:hypothetical protein K458DRAFT_382553 [Lentithecium fluviatile CBS 122367]|uniref:Uncharacterized protein n=1 Tax=Lentithecium fluviatile CBS 122367 TaxID=1168545 RepID=A0A6G1JK85_9PLEO|nr:hypothetical protein K458DRAFT_382553 [Lentithecium fluviatile CBS 122367]